MENFDFATACELITSRLLSGGGNPERVWRLYFPRMVYFEIEEAEAVQNILGLRRPVAVQQRVCRSFWKHCFKSEPLPWIEDPKVEKRTFGLGEEMEIALMKEVMAVAAAGDTKAALAMLATNSMNPKKTDSKETAKESVASKPKPAATLPKPVPVLPKPAPVPSKPVIKPAVESSDKNARQSDWRRRDDRSRSPSSSRSLTARRRSF